jgi:pyruvate,water dikinase
VINEIQRWIRKAPVPDKIISDIHDAYTELSRRGKANGEFVAVRSSATAEDTKAASFAGMNRSFTNVRGADAITSIP